MIHIVGFSQCVPHSQAIGQWKNPDDQFSEGYRQIEMWCHIAKTLERGLADGFFLADVHGVYDVYGNSRDAAHKYAVQTPGVDPMLLTSAMANVTTHLGFINTYSTTFHAPYECARAFSSLDHFTNGRIGWNIVTSYTHSAEANGIGNMLNHDKRYDRADEYMDVVYKLWESSWENDAVIQDVKKDLICVNLQFKEHLCYFKQAHQAGVQNSVLSMLKGFSWNILGFLKITHL
jgi:alkanesulfonate monooxygenase SsuD/methylene tetrahydromethanopterin reductase-like flavin-dependent oxidoreductase (luciferase family)